MRIERYLCNVWTSVPMTFQSQLWKQKYFQCANQYVNNLPKELGDILWCVGGRVSVLVGVLVWACQCGHVPLHSWLVVWLTRFLQRNCRQVLTSCDDLLNGYLGGRCGQFKKCSVLSHILHQTVITCNMQFEEGCIMGKYFHLGNRRSCVIIVQYLASLSSNL